MAGHSRRDFLKCAGAAGLAALVVAAYDSGSEAEAQDKPGMKSASAGSLSRILSRKTSYLILLDHPNFRIVNDIEKLVGLPGKYGHIEVIYNNKVFGCRPPECSERRLSDIERHFRGARYRIVKPDFDGNPEEAVMHFRENIAGSDYDFMGFEDHDSWDSPNFNCTDLVNILSSMSGNRLTPVKGVDVFEAYYNNIRLKEFMDRNLIRIPNRKVVYFPDEYMEIGKVVAQGRF